MSTISSPLRTWKSAAKRSAPPRPHYPKAEPDQLIENRTGGLPALRTAWIEARGDTYGSDFIIGTFASGTGQLRRALLAAMDSELGPDPAAENFAGPGGD